MILYILDTLEMLAKLLERRKHHWTQEEINRLNMSISYLNNLKIGKREDIE